jgi:hypothetical protein
MKILLGLLFVMFTLAVMAQYPSDSKVIADVKSENSSEFKEITPKGKWYLTHDRIPDWQKPNAAERNVHIIGSKNQSGEWWEYSGNAIYHLNGSGYNFNRVYIFEEPRLHGVPLPDNAFFLDQFKKLLLSKEKLFMMMNYNIANAVNFYSIELAGEPWLTGNKTERYVVFDVDVVLDVVNGYSIEKRKQTIKVKLDKKGDNYAFKSAQPLNDGEFLSQISYPSNDQLRDLISFKDFNGTLFEFVKPDPSYPAPPGYNGDDLPTDNEIIEYIENWALKSSSNFGLLFGERAKTMFIDMSFNSMNGAQVIREGDIFSKSFQVYYEFINEKTESMEFYVYGGVREIILKFKIDNGSWDINSFEYNGETNYTKNDKIAWNYRNGYKEKTFDKTVLKNK